MQCQWWAWIWPLAAINCFGVGIDLRQCARSFFLSGVRRRQPRRVGILSGRSNGAANGRTWLQWLILPFAGTAVTLILALTFPGAYLPSACAGTLGRPPAEERSGPVHRDGLAASKLCRRGRLVA